MRSDPAEKTQWRKLGKLRRLHKTTGLFLKRISAIIWEAIVSDAKLQNRACVSWLDQSQCTVKRANGVDGAGSSSVPALCGSRYLLIVLAIPRTLAESGSAWGFAINHIYRDFFFSISII